MGAVFDEEVKRRVWGLVHADLRLSSSCMCMSYRALLFEGENSVLLYIFDIKK